MELEYFSANFSAKVVLYSMCSSMLSAGKVEKKKIKKKKSNVRDGKMR